MVVNLQQTLNKVQNTRRSSRAKKVGSTKIKKVAWATSNFLRLFLS